MFMDRGCEKTLITYIGREGDTLIKIAELFHVSIYTLITFNPHIESSSNSLVGRKIRIPTPNDTSIKNIANTFSPYSCAPAPALRENWITLTPLEQMEKIEYDVLVIGSGAGGGAVTWRLSEQWGRNEKKIGVIESGDFLIPTAAQNIATMNNERMEKYHKNVSKPLGEFLPEFRGANQVYAFGGRTLFWNAISPRMSKDEMADWPVTFEEMESYFTIAERVMNVSQKYTAGSSITKVLLNRLQQSGVTEAKASPLAANLSSGISKQMGSEVFFSAISFFAQALNRRPIDLAINTRATQLLVDKGKVVGVEVMSQEKKPYVIKAKKIVLSASTFETPRMLLHSGIQGRAIGHYLMNHSFVTATGNISRKEFPGIIGTLGILIPSRLGRPYQIQIRGPGEYFWYQPYEEKPFLEDLEVNFLCFGEVEPRFENKITLDPHRKDEFGVPEIQAHFSFSEKDQAIIDEIGLAVQQISSFGGIRTNPESIFLLPPGDLNHDSGTCRMGNDSATSAVNRYGQVHGVKGLYVADNSVFPSIGAPNLTLSTVALAIRTADHIIRQG
jgi:choline dehydrogenase-like flavoprotein